MRLGRVSLGKLKYVHVLKKAIKFAMSNGFKNYDAGRLDLRILRILRSFTSHQLLPNVNLCSCCRRI
ncbi:uncharacterized protein VTP21DRAFT_1121 [Calcarisporiella thermophila]|uniref:uncharacterized protein n=1 Tax=Calcarisporiella thermophila TaxID=911321 RepID=UPI003742BC2C